MVAPELVWYKLYIFLSEVCLVEKSTKNIWGEPLNVLTSYLYFWGMILQNKLQIWEMQAHQN